MWDPKDLPEDSLQLSPICLRWSTWCGYLWRSVLWLRSGRPFALVSLIRICGVQTPQIGATPKSGKATPEHNGQNYLAVQGGQVSGCHRGTKRWRRRFNSQHRGGKGYRCKLRPHLADTLLGT